VGGNPDPLAQLDASPIFVVGVARSGTTWVHDALRGHPLVGAVFESMLFERLTGMGGLLGDAHWGNRPRGVAQLASREEVVGEVRRLASELLGRALKPHHRYLVEKTPGHVMMIGEIAEVFPESRFVHVLRDGRDVAVSMRAARRTWARGARTRPFGFSLPMTARRWQRALRYARGQGVALGDRMLEVRYEELRADPVGSYRLLFDFCGIPYDDELLERIHQKTDFELSGRSNKPGGFYRGGRVGDWRTHFNLVDGLLFNAVAGEGLIEAGYEQDRRWLAPLRRKVPVRQAG
jgi:hypothetical protein